MQRTKSPIIPKTPIALSGIRFLHRFSLWDISAIVANPNPKVKPQSMDLFDRDTTQYLTLKAETKAMPAIILQITLSASVRRGSVLLQT